MDSKITAVVSFSVSPNDIDELLKLTEKTQGIFKKQEGFISSRLLVSQDKKSLMQIIEWESLEDSLNCMKSSDWESSESKEFMEFIDSGKASMKPENFTVHYRSN